MPKLLSFFRMFVAVIGSICAADEGTLAATPQYDHVVIVMEENHDASQIIGDRVNAPFMNTLMDGGVRFASQYAIQHPSQPNYIHLFSGTNQGMNDDNLPKAFSTTATASYPFRAANLAAELFHGGFTFSGFAEELESAGVADWADYDPHTADSPTVHYRRRHVPWVNWVAKASPIPTNQIPAAFHKAFISFPTDFRQLPSVSFVIPSLLNDMHDGTRKEADAWLQQHLSAYAAWARTNNSLLIINWDEDDKVTGNLIPMIFYGAHLRTGSIVKSTWTHHNVLRTIEDIFRLQEHAGAAGRVRPIVGAFASDPNVATVSFQDGVNGYAGTIETQLKSAQPTATFLDATNVIVGYDADSGTTGNQPAQALIRFDRILGAATNQIPRNAVIQSAKLLLNTLTNSASAGSFALHRMLKQWDENDTWQSLGAGISFDEIEAKSAPSFTVEPSVENAPVVFDVSDDIAAFQSGATNYGWALHALSDAGSDTWNFGSSKATVAAMRPRLEVTYSLPAPQTPFQEWAAAKKLSAPYDTFDADPDGDGMPNLLEFAFNMDPLSADAHGLGSNDVAGTPSASVRYNSGTWERRIDFIRRRDTISAKIAYSVEFSSDLVNWSQAAVVETAPIDDTFERASATDPVSTPEAARFARVAVTIVN